MPKAKVVCKERLANTLGTVDHMDGEKNIKLNKKDSADGQQHWIPVDWVESVDEKSRLP